MQVHDGTSRHRSRGRDLGLFVLLGTFSEYTVVHEDSCAVVDPDLPLELACVIGCAGVTGWGASLNTARVRPGDTTVVVGAGGIGSCAIQGARHAGADLLVAVDPVPFKREMALRFGATHAVADMAEAREVVGDLTRGLMADSVIMAAAVGDGRQMRPALGLAGKRGTVVVVNVHPDDETEVHLSLRDLQSYEKRVVGCLAGSWSGRQGIRYLAERYRRGELNLEDLVTRSYDLDDLGRGFADQALGRNIRGVVRHGRT